MLIQIKIERLAQLNSHLVPDEFRADDSRDGLKRGLVQFSLFEEIHETGEAARAVATHLGFAAVGVVIPHPVVGSVDRWLDGEKTVRSDPTLTIAELRDLFLA